MVGTLGTTRPKVEEKFELLTMKKLDAWDNLHPRISKESCDNKIQIFSTDLQLMCQRRLQLYCLCIQQREK